MPRRSKKRRVMAEMNVVPYIDVMLVLLVIFMVTAPMMQSGVNVNMPNIDAPMLDTNNDQAPLYITVKENGEISLNDGTKENIVTPNELTQKMQRLLDDKGLRPVYIRADGNAIHTYVTRAMVAAQKAGAKKISWMTSPVKVDQQ